MRKEGEALKYNADCFFKQVRVTNHQASPGEPTFRGLLQLDFDVHASGQIELEADPAQAVTSIQRTVRFPIGGRTAIFPEGSAGTGYGVGSAWLLAGARPGVPLVSVDVVK